MHSLSSRAAHLCARGWLLLTHMAPTRPPPLRQYVVPRSAHEPRFSQAIAKATRLLKSSSPHLLFFQSLFFFHPERLSVYYLPIYPLLGRQERAPTPSDRKQGHAELPVRRRNMSRSVHPHRHLVHSLASHSMLTGHTASSGAAAIAAASCGDA